MFSNLVKASSVGALGSQDVSGCLRMCQDVSGCVRMCQDVSLRKYGPLLLSLQCNPVTTFSMTKEFRGFRHVIFEPTQ